MPVSDSDFAALTEQVSKVRHDFNNHAMETKVTMRTLAQRLDTADKLVGENTVITKDALATAQRVEDNTKALITAFSDIKGAYNVFTVLTKLGLGGGFVTGVVYMVKKLFP